MAVSLVSMGDLTVGKREEEGGGLGGTILVSSELFRCSGSIYWESGSVRLGPASFPIRDFGSVFSFSLQSLRMYL